jgi:paraquat-inducible protein B
MTTTHQGDAKIKPIRTISAIWFIPVIALLIGAWMIYYQWSNQGEIVTIHFSSAEGLEAGKTKIKSRNVNIGEVKSITLNENADGVIVTARMLKNAEKILVEDSQFWIVSPRISLTGISGLSTLVSGVYIEISPGSSKNESFEFKGLTDPPITPLGTPGMHLTLNSDDQFAFNKGDPIIYKGLKVGQFEDIYFNFDERIVYYNAFIKAPYHQLITTNTKFWNASGLSVELTADGLTVNTGSVETILTNGITFDVPKGMPSGDPISERAYFDIYPNYEVASDQRYKHSLQYVVLVSDTIRGLMVGAPVEYRGVLIGHVASTNIVDNEANEFFDEDIKIPVLINLQPGRVGLPDDDSGVARMDKQNKHWVMNGLKAQLKTGNYLTGRLFVELQHFENHPVTAIETYAGYKVIPTTNDQFSQITEKLNVFIDNLNSLPLNDVASNANATLVEVTKLSQNLQSVSKNLEILLSDVNQEELGEQLRISLESITTLSQDFSSGSANYEQLEATLKTFTELMHEVSPVLKQIKHQPNSLIFNPGIDEKIMPKKHNGIQP